MNFIANTIDNFEIIVSMDAELAFGVYGSKVVIGLSYIKFYKATSPLTRVNLF